MVKAEFPIGKTQWRKWGDEAREAYNRMRRLGSTHETAVAEGNAVQAKVRSAALQELADLGQEQGVEYIQLPKGAFFPDADEKPAEPVKKPAAPKKRTAPSMKAK
jgi:hypothetical protein